MKNALKTKQNFSQIILKILKVTYCTQCNERVKKCFKENIINKKFKNLSKVTVALIAVVVVKKFTFLFVFER